MIPRTVAVPTLLAAAVAVPYAASNAPQWQQQWNAPPGAAALALTPGTPALGPNAAYSAAPPALAAPVGPARICIPIAAPLEGLPGYSLADVFRFDVTKEWVYQRWPRKSTALAEIGLYGVRVPLVSGTQLHDLAGSLTYYFTPEGRVQLITFRGRTGDTTQLVALATQRFGLQRQPTIAAGEQLYQVRRGDDVLSSLRTRPSPVLWTSSPHDSFAVELELQHPEMARPLAQHLPEPPAAAPEPPPPSGGEEGAAAAAAGGDPPAASWKAFFPRRSVPAEQIPNLDHGNIYQ